MGFRDVSIGKGKEAEQSRYEETILCPVPFGGSKKSLDVGG